MAFLGALGREAPGGVDPRLLPGADHGAAISTGLDTFGSATAGQNDLIAQLKQIVTGEQQSLAEQMLFNATQRGAEQQAGLIASQRGLSPQLAARQAQMTGARMAQDAAGQGAELRAKETNAAQDLIGRLLGQQQGNSVNLYGTGSGAQNQSNQNQIYNQQLEQRAHEQDIQAANQLIGTVTGAAGKAILPFAGGGAPMAVPALTPSLTGPNIANAPGGVTSYSLPGGQPQSLAPGLAHGGAVSDEFLSAYRATHGKDPSMSAEMLLAFNAGKQAKDMTAGGEVPGEPKHPGVDTEANDDVPIIASPKEVMLPLSVTQAEDPAEAAYRFMLALQEQEDGKDALSRSPGRLLAR